VRSDGHYRSKDMELELAGCGDLRQKWSENYLLTLEVNISSRPKLFSGMAAVDPCNSLWARKWVLRRDLEPQILEVVDLVRIAPREENPCFCLISRTVVLEERLKW